MKAVALLTFSTIAFAAGAIAAPWPSWRGPSNDNTSPETKFPLEWSATKNRRWRIDLPEAGNASPIVWGNRVFLTQAVEDGKQRTLMCFDRGTGKMLWQHGVTYEGTDPHHKANPHCSASPVTDGERIVASFGSAGVVAYDFSGKELWRTDLGKQTHEWGQGSSPVLHGDSVIVYHGPGAGSTLHALDKKTGAKRWSVPLKEAHPAERFDGFAGKNDGAVGTFATPLVIKAGEREEIVLPVVNRVRAFAPADGRELWNCDGMNPLVYSSPTYGEGTLVAIGGFFGSAIYLKPGGNGDVTDKRLAYERRMKKHTIGSPIIKDGHAYVCATPGFAQCFDLKTGTMLWEERLPATGADSETWASMVLAGDRLYIPNRSGDTIVLRAAPKFEVLASNPVGELSNSTLALSDGDVFLRTHKALWCFREEKPATN